ncbi:helix-turn-helix domain-containing protein [Cellulomonas sp. NS3]|uniref:helix-turn-helix domain-containing protein n=1 Tax=Cellulomonas sp. NS3 TaxID=2973977 RepID=UPI0021632423|nr:helix-turn-helix domain-containing protein [Cellulomonas sp. NS3]
MSTTATTHAPPGAAPAAAPAPTPTPAEQAARRARQHATVVASLAAVVPTLLAAQGMASVAMDVLGFTLVAAVALAGFLELALVSSALLARASALAGRPGGADAAAVWAVSAVSGLLAGTHEFVGPEVDGVRSWESDPSTLLAAGVRVVAPLVAAWLWERVLTAARREHADRTLVEVRRDRRLLAVARAALVVRRLEESGHAQGRRIRWARRRLDRAHVAALRAVPPGADLPTVLAAVGAVDLLPTATGLGRFPGSGAHALPVETPAPASWRTPAPDAALVDEAADGLDARPVGTFGAPVAAGAVGFTDTHTAQRPVVRAAEGAIREAAIRQLAASGLSQRSIAARVGVSKSTVARVLGAAVEVSQETGALPLLAHRVPAGAER